MEFKTLKNGFKLPVLGLGTFGIGGLMEKDSTLDNESIEVIKTAISLGYLHIDTAEIYAAGHSEELIGQAIYNLDRSNIFITSKVFKNHLKYDEVINSCKQSLNRLQTNYIDLYLVHAPNPDVPIEETMRALNFLVEHKLIRFIGVSNFSVEQLKEAQKHTKNKIVVNQIPYNLNTRDKNHLGVFKDMESEIIPYCQQNDILVVAYRPIERGFLLKPNVILDNLAKKYNQTKAQIVINWLISKKNVVTIIKSTKIEHLKENLGALGWSLSSDDIILLDKTHFKNPSEN